MSELLRELQRIRKDCAGLAQSIDDLLSRIEVPVLPLSDTIPMAVEGRCHALTRHALERYRQRTGSLKSDATIATRIACAIASGEEWEMKAQFRLVELIAHGQAARYFKTPGELIYIVENGVVVTCHHGRADKWQKKTN